MKTIEIILKGGPLSGRELIVREEMQYIEFPAFEGKAQAHDNYNHTLLKSMAKHIYRKSAVPHVYEYIYTSEK